MTSAKRRRRGRQPTNEVTLTPPGPPQASSSERQSISKSNEKGSGKKIFEELREGELMAKLDADRSESEN